MQQGSIDYQMEEESLFNEAETWNVISHINKRYSYGKSLRYSDRFYRNWAIQIGAEEDKLNKQRQNDWRGSNN